MGHEGRAPRCGALSFLPWLGIVLAAGLVAISFFPTTNVVLVSCREKTLFIAPMGPQDQLVYSYLHSVERTVVREYFQVHDQSLILTHTEMQSQGAGLPSEYADGFSLNQGWLSLPMNRSFPKLILRSSSATKQSLTTPTSTLNLSTLPEGSRVEIEVTRRPVIWLRLKGVLN